MMLLLPKASTGPEHRTTFQKIPLLQETVYVAFSGAVGVQILKPCLVRTRSLSSVALRQPGANHVS
jgi:hypothetical protein